MNELAIRQDNAPAISGDTTELIKAGESANTLRACQRALQSLSAWLANPENAFRLDQRIRRVRSSERIDQATEQGVIKRPNRIK